MTTKSIEAKLLQGKRNQQVWILEKQTQEQQIAKTTTKNTRTLILNIIQHHK